MDQFLSQITSKELEGWQPLLGLAPSSLPKGAGVYAVVYLGVTPFRFMAESSGGWHKGRNPTVSTAMLEERWIPSTKLVYIGKTNNLRRRLKAFSDFGTGKAVGHWGGRLIWQLPQVETLQVGWLLTPDHDPRIVEREMLDAFTRIFNRRPFANLAA